MFGRTDQAVLAGPDFMVSKVLEFAVLGINRFLFFLGCCLHILSVMLEQSHGKAAALINQCLFGHSLQVLDL